MKKIIVALSAVLLGSGIGVSTLSTSTPVQAAHHSANSSYWYKNRKVKVTKTIKFRKFDAYNRRYVRGTKTYRKGKVIKVRAAGEFPGWVLATTKPGSHYWWISERFNTSWMREY